MKIEVINHMAVGRIFREKVNGGQINPSNHDRSFWNLYEGI